MVESKTLESPLLSTIAVGVVHVLVSTVVRRARTSTTDIVFFIK